MSDFTIDNGIGGARVAPSGTGTIPFARADLNDTKQVLVHFKIADENKLLRLELAQAINEALRPVRVNGHAIVPIITDESVTMTALDVQILAAHMLPAIKRALGLPVA